MAFRIEAGEPLGEAFRRIAREELDGAIEALTGAGGAGTDAAVHDARKRFKRLRALMRLARGSLGRKAAGRERLRFRDAARPLSEARDAGVLVEAFETLVERADPPVDPAAADAIRAALLDRKRAASDRVLADGRALERAADAAREALGRLDRWRFEGDGWGVLRPGLARIDRAGARAFRAAQDDPSEETLHEWRKRVKDLWYVLEILRPIRPATLEALADRAHRLSDLLGDEHDLAVLAGLLADPAGGLGDLDAAGAARPAIERRREALRSEAMALGPEVHDAPGALSNRLRAFWRAWRSEAEAARLD